MPTRWIPAFWLLATACVVDGSPLLAADPMWIEPDPGGDVHGFATWQVYGGDTLSPQAYLCAEVFELAGTPTEPDCRGCTHAWEVATASLETDCDAELAVRSWPTVTRIAIGTSHDDLALDAPHSEVLGGSADYGEGWVEHGWAYPAALDEGDDTADPAWDGVQPFTLAPAWAWPLDD